MTATATTGSDWTHVHPLNCTTEHVRDWKLEDAVREIVTNAVDAEPGLLHRPDGIKFSRAAYDGYTMVVSNKTSSPLEGRHLVQGPSTKKGKDSFFGGFGCGLKDALVVFAREGIRVTITTAKWTGEVDAQYVEQFLGEDLPPQVCVRARASHDFDEVLLGATAGVRIELRSAAGSPNVLKAAYDKCGFDSTDGFKKLADDTAGLDCGSWGLVPNPAKKGPGELRVTLRGLYWINVPIHGCRGLVLWLTKLKQEEREALGRDRKNVKLAVIIETFVAAFSHLLQHQLSHLSPAHQHALREASRRKLTHTRLAAVLQQRFPEEENDDAAEEEPTQTVAPHYLPPSPRNPAAHAASAMGIVAERKRLKKLRAGLQKCDQDIAQLQNQLQARQHRRAELSAEVDELEAQIARFDAEREAQRARARAEQQERESAAQQERERAEQQQREREAQRLREARWAQEERERQAQWDRDQAAQWARENDARQAREREAQQARKREAKQARKREAKQARAAQEARDREARRTRETQRQWQAQQAREREAQRTREREAQREVETARILHRYKLPPLQNIGDWADAKDLSDDTRRTVDAVFHRVCVALQELRCTSITDRGSTGRRVALRGPEVDLDVACMWPGSWTFSSKSDAVQKLRVHFDVSLAFWFEPEGDIAVLCDVADNIAPQHPIDIAFCLSPQAFRRGQEFADSLGTDDDLQRRLAITLKRFGRHVRDADNLSGKLQGSAFEVIAQTVRREQMYFANNLPALFRAALKKMSHTDSVPELRRRFPITSPAWRQLRVAAEDVERAYAGLSETRSSSQLRFF